MVEIKRLQLKIKGMHCVSCENLIRDAVLNLNGVKTISVSYTTEKATVEFDSTKTDSKDILNVIKDAGYEPLEIGEQRTKGIFKNIFG